MPLNIFYEEDEEDLSVDVLQDRRSVSRMIVAKKMSGINQHVERAGSHGKLRTLRELLLEKVE